MKTKLNVWKHTHHDNSGTAGNWKMLSIRPLLRGAVAFRSIASSVATLADHRTKCKGWMHIMDQLTHAETTGSVRKTASRLGLWSAVLTAACAAVFSAIAIATPARSGPFCATWGCVAYPYTDVAQFIPGDYFWLVPGILLAPIFVVLFACIHSFAPEGKKLFSQIALSFAVVYAVIIIVDYFVQFAVVMPSLQSGEIDGLSLFTQYNPHGFFIAGETLGYLMMSVAFLFAAPLFTGGRAERVIRGLFALSFALAVVSFVGLWLLKNDLVAFEVTVLMINWIVLIISGALLSVVFRQAARHGGAIT